MAAAPGGNDGFDFDRWCLQNKLPEKIVEWLKKEEFITPDLLVYFGERDEKSLRSTGVGAAHIRKLEAAIEELASSVSNVDQPSETLESKNTLADEARGSIPATVVEAGSKQGDKETDNDIYVVLYDHEQQEPGTIHLQKGEQVKILDFGDGHWYWAQSLDNQDEGWVLPSYVEPQRDPVTHENSSHPTGVTKGRVGQAIRQYEASVEGQKFKPNTPSKSVPLQKPTITQDADQEPPPALSPKLYTSVSRKEPLSKKYEPPFTSSTTGFPTVYNINIEYHDDNSVQVSWDKSLEAVEGYKLEITTSQDPSVVIERQILSPEKTSATCSSLQPSTRYTIKLMTLSGTKESEPLIKTICTSERRTNSIANSRASNRSLGNKTDSSTLDFLTTGPLYQQLQSNQAPTIGTDMQTPKVFWTSNLGQTWSDLVKSSVRYDMSPKQQQLQEALFEVLKTEGSFVHSMTILVDHFMSDKDLKKSIKPIEYKDLFSNATEVLKASQRFLSDLKASQQENAIITDVCDIIKTHAKKNMLFPYKYYCKKLPLQMNTLKTLTDGTQSQELNQNFCDALKELELDERCGKLPFSSFLLLPMQRITRFPLLVERIMNLREQGTELFSTAVDALADVRDVSKQCDQATRKEQQMMELEDLVNKLRYDRVKLNFPLLSRDRSVVKQGELTLVPKKGTTEKYHVVLLTDYLLVTKKEDDKKVGSVLSLRNFCKRNRVDVHEIDSIYEGCEDQSVAKKEQKMQNVFRNLFRPKLVEENFKFRMTLLEDWQGMKEEMVFAAKTPSQLTRWVEAFYHSEKKQEGWKTYGKENCPIARVILRRDPEGPDELALEEGDTLFVLRKKPDDLWFGETMHDERQGWFPATVVEEVESDHLKGKQLMTEHVTLRKKKDDKSGVHRNAFLALYDYEPQNPDEIRLKKGQRLTILDDSGDWFKARTLDKDLPVGLVPHNYITPLDDLQTHEWFVGSLERREAEERLIFASNPIGTFLVRSKHPDGTETHAYTISVLRSTTGHNKVNHFKVNKTSEGTFTVTDHDEEFDSLPELVDDLVENGKIGDCIMTTPCPAEKSERPESHYEKWEISRDNIILGKTIGQGHFGDVREGLWKEEVKVAVKSAKKGAMPDDLFLQEANTMTKLHHANIVQLLGVCTKEDPIYIITEFVCNGSLEGYLKGEHGKRLSLVHQIDMATQVAAGMEYLESNSVIHRDLRAANVLVGNRNLCKVADFGMARLRVESIYVSKRNVMPFRWTAIEAIDQKEFTSQSDVWSFGILMTEILTKGRMPYADIKDNDGVIAQVRHGYRMPPEDDWPEPLYEIMQRCWLKEPNERPTFIDLNRILTNYFSNDKEYY
ncbi:uncharacterized protein [Branchiostoma lanceolatum]|uniref:uncharacterized protein n=1 Tax=Branchiostoma lanceolatum TaxID=7740 RepID=UPI00345585AB